MTSTPADCVPTVVFADELAESDIISARCYLRTSQIKDDEDRSTGFASCAYLSRPHQATEHHLAIERLRRGPGATYAITRNEDDEQVGWSAVKNEPVRTLR